MPFLSIELGKHRFKVILLDRTKDVLTVQQDMMLTIMPSEDFSSKVTEMLRDFIYRYDVTDRKVYLTIADPNVIILKNAVFPVLPPAELVPAITWHAKEEGALSEDSTVVNYEVVKQFTGDDGAQKEAVTFSIVNKRLLDATIKILTKLGLTVAQVTAAPLNTPKVLACYGETPSAQVVLDLGYGASTMAIYKKGKLLFVRTLSFSYGKAKLSLSDPFFLGAKYRTPEADAEIEQAILSIGIPRDPFAVGGGGDRATQFFGLMRPLLEVLVREIRYSLAYFSTNLKEEKPATLFLTGHGSKFHDLDVYLGRELEMTVMNLHLPSSVRSLHEGESEDPVHLSQCVSAVAGVLPGHGTVDFTPFEEKRRKAESFQRGVLRLITLGLVGVFAISFFFVQFRIAAQADTLKLEEKYLQSLGKFAQASQGPFERHDLARELEEGTLPPEKVLRLLAHLIPSELALRNFILDSSKRSVSIELETSGLDEGGNPMIEEVVRRLRETSLFKAVTVKELPGYSVSVYQVVGVFCDD